MIDFASDRPVHRQLADILRESITSGRLAVGVVLPAEHRMAAEYGIGRDSVRAALTTLRAEGLVVTRRPYGSRVRSDGTRTPHRLPRGATARVRLPDPSEALQLGIDALTPVVEIRHGLNKPVVLDATTVDLSTS